MYDPCLDRSLQAKSTVSQHLEHNVVVSQDLRLEFVNPIGARDGDEMVEET